ncbi:hypothetical protein RS84_00052 [Microbacterium hydrocarbonoxydans]|uniref:Uncharacterized protein n=1 Tax=Microbacterium hydrocarbonoxydans TaxID=273678 RepID=A0A0M2HYQ3_9MICO|nr:hypothetical protein [Microbacterium hydrocarbonoxydans]KJL49578.1 hypothetical protein RS84_00052 [Microbacterium hydrocarbonoxydans]
MMSEFIAYITANPMMLVVMGGAGLIGLAAAFMAYLDDEPLKLAFFGLGGGVLSGTALACVLIPLLS